MKDALLFILPTFGTLLGILAGIYLAHHAAGSKTLEVTRAHPRARYRVRASAAFAASVGATEVEQAIRDTAQALVAQVHAYCLQHGPRP